MNKAFEIELVCINCGRRYDIATNPMTCSDCGPSGTLDFDYNWEHLRDKVSPEAILSTPGFDFTRYAPLLPLPCEDVPLRVGGTPLIASPRLGKEIGHDCVWVKDESSQPSGSLKDRASVLAVLHAKSLGKKRIATASTGNAASSLAAISAAMGLEAVIFVPEAAPRPKLVQLQIYGATLFPVKGTYDDAFALCLEACREFGWYNRNTGMNPYCAEGKKTCALEIWEQMGGQVPDHVFVSVGDGCILAGISKGFRDLYHLGWADRMPRLYGVQAEGSSVIAEGYRLGESINPVGPTTYADSISVSRPADYRKAWRAVEETEGRFVIISDEEIRQAVRLLARKSGIFGEPSGAASVAGLMKQSKQGSISPSESAVCVMTGSGLKDIDGARSACGPLPDSIPPDLEAVRRRLES